eukprot:2463458-Lingulodinium_polyedra.AAC.1
MEHGRGPNQKDHERPDRSCIDSCRPGPQVHASALATSKVIGPQKNAFEAGTPLGCPGGGGGGRSG